MNKDENLRDKFVVVGLQSVSTSLQSFWDFFLKNWSDSNCNFDILLPNTSVASVIL